MRLALATLLLATASATALAIPDTLSNVVRDNHSPTAPSEADARENHAPVAPVAPADDDALLAARGSIHVNIAELKEEINRESERYDRLRQMGEHAAARRKLRRINALKAKLRAYLEADSESGGKFGFA